MTHQMFSTLDNISNLNPKRIAIHVKPAAERAVKQGHPWLFESGIRKQNRNGRSGDLAILFDRKNRFLAVGLYDPDSPIRVRILHKGEPATIDAAWFETKIQTAVSLRTPLRQTQTTAYRLIHGPNDSFPGLVIDKYDQTMVLKLYSAIWLPHLHSVLTALHKYTQPARIVLRLSRGVQQQTNELGGLQDGMLLAGEPLQNNMVQFQENGLNFAANLIDGQKTGFFLDQRDNRARVEKLAQGRTVLNVFAYTGGFSLYAARGGATRVVSLDLSRPALETAVHNFQLNRTNAAIASAIHEQLVGDAFQELEALIDRRQKFDMVIIDPPSFAHNQAQVERALSAYGRLVRLGLQVMEQRGILVMASCSSRISADDFFRKVNEAARKGKRPLIEIERTGHALDHPISFKESAYLKCLFATVP